MAAKKHLSLFLPTLALCFYLNLRSDGWTNVFWHPMLTNPIAILGFLEPHAYNHPQSERFKALCNMIIFLWTPSSLRFKIQVFTLAHSPTGEQHRRTVRVKLIDLSLRWAHLWPYLIPALSSLQVHNLPHVVQVLSLRGWCSRAAAFRRWQTMWNWSNRHRCHSACLLHGANRLQGCLAQAVETMFLGERFRVQSPVIVTGL